MSPPVGEAPRRQNQSNGNWTQFDRELIMAARDKRPVNLYFSLKSLQNNEAEISGIIQVVDRYMVKIFDSEGFGVPFWVQKSHIFAVRIAG